MSELDDAIAALALAVARLEAAPPPTPAAPPPEPAADNARLREVAAALAVRVDAVLDRIGQLLEGEG